MRLEVVDITKSDKDVLEVDILKLAERITVQPFGDKWVVQFVDPYRLATIFDEKDEAIREMVGLKRDYLRIQTEKAIEAAKTPVLTEMEDIEDEDPLSVEDLDIYYSDEEEDDTGL